MSTELFKPNITEFEDEKQLYHYAESFVIDEMLEQIGEEGSFRLALSGGSTPLPLYHMLGANSSLPWEEVEIYQTDERFVSTFDPNSNQTSIRNAFGTEALGRFKDFYFIPVDQTMDYALSNYNEVIDSLDIPTFDLCILGIGSDGHIASLFSNSEYLGHQDKLVIGTLASGTNPVKERISLTIETILNSKKILVLLNGLEKSEVLGELVAGSKSAKEFPAKFLLAHPQLTIFTHIPKAEDIDEDAVI